MLRNKINNRRRGPDRLIKAISIFVGISWFLILIVFIFYLNSKPRDASIFDMRFSVANSYKGNPSLLTYANIALILNVIICFIGLMINMTRHKRKKDRYSKSLIFFGIGSIIWLIYNLLFK
jgi:hypothetical protein